MENAGQACAECLAPVSVAVNAQSGASLCPQCAAQFYHPCARCGGLIPQDEAVVRRGQTTERPAGRDQRATQAARSLPTTSRQRRAAARRRGRGHLPL
jgi:hypothetical protein